MTTLKVTKISGIGVEIEIARHRQATIKARAFNIEKAKKYLDYCVKSGDPAMIEYAKRKLLEEQNRPLHDNMCRTIDILKTYNNEGEMNMSNHTQGPWRVGEGESSITTVRGEHVLSLPYPLYPASQPDEFSSNARLMAAAPDLLEACKGMIETLTGHNDAWEALTIQQKARVITMKEAINKAEGKV